MRLTANALVQELWNIFTFYTLHGDPLDPDHIRVSCQRGQTETDSFPQGEGGDSPPAAPPLPTHPPCQASQFVKVARDCQIVGSSLSEADPPLSEADINVSFTAEVTKAEKKGSQQGGDRKKMNYNDFLTALMKLSVKVYPRSKTVDDAFQVSARPAPSLPRPASPRLALPAAADGQHPAPRLPPRAGQHRHVHGERGRAALV